MGNILPNPSNESVSKDGHGVAPLVPVVTNPKSKTQTFASFSPPGKGFDLLAFQNWLDKGGRNYLQLNPYTVKGLKEVLAFSDIVGSDIVWTKELRVLYADVLPLVKKKGRPGDWTISAKEGLH